MPAADMAALVRHACRVTEKGNYTEKDAAAIILQILRGVAYLHSHGARKALHMLPPV